MSESGKFSKEDIKNFGKSKVIYTPKREYSYSEIPSIKKALNINNSKN